MSKPNVEGKEEKPNVGGNEVKPNEVKPNVEENKKRKFKFGKFIEDVLIFGSIGAFLFFSGALSAAIIALLAAVFAIKQRKNLRVVASKSLSAVKYLGRAIFGIKDKNKEQNNTQNINNIKNHLNINSDENGNLDEQSKKQIEKPIDKPAQTPTDELKEKPIDEKVENPIIHPKELVDTSLVEDNINEQIDIIKEQMYKLDNEIKTLCEQFDKEEKYYYENSNSTEVSKQVLNQRNIYQTKINELNDEKIKLEHKLDELNKLANDINNDKIIKLQYKLDELNELDRLNNDKREKLQLKLNELNKLNGEKNKNSKLSTSNYNFDVNNSNNKHIIKK